MRSPGQFKKNVDCPHQYRLSLGQPVHFLQNLPEIVEACTNVRMMRAQVLLKNGL